MLLREGGRGGPQAAAWAERVLRGDPGSGGGSCQERTMLVHAASVLGIPSGVTEA